MKPNKAIDAQLAALSEVFANDILGLVRRELPRLVEQALAGAETTSNGRTRQGAGVRRGTRSHSLEPSASNGTAAGAIFDRYERMALLRAIAECGGKVHIAGRLLGRPKSTMYRRLHELGIWPEVEAGQVRPAADDPLVGSGQQVTLPAYERLAYVHALQLAGGDRMGAARLLGIGKSTIYRKVKEHGIG